MEPHDLPPSKTQKVLVESQINILQPMDFQIVIENPFLKGQFIIGIFISLSILYLVDLKIVS